MGNALFPGEQHCEVITTPSFAQGRTLELAGWPAPSAGQGATVNCLFILMDVLLKTAFCTNQLKEDALKDIWKDALKDILSFFIHFTNEGEPCILGISGS